MNYSNFATWTNVKPVDRVSLNKYLLLPKEEVSKYSPR